MNTIDALSILENSVSSEERRIALEYLVDSKVYNDRIIDFFAQGLSSSDPGIKDVSARGLSEAPSSFRANVAQIVAPMILNESIELRNLAADILVQLGDYAGESLYPYLNHPSNDVKKFSSDILGLVGNEHTLDMIYELLNDHDLNVKNSAIESIGNICSRIRDAGLDPKIPVTRLITLYDEYEETRPLIIETIGKIGGAEAEKFLINRISTEEDLFIQTILIDSISFAVNNPDVAASLQSLIPISPEPLKKVILKAVCAISFRTGNEVNLPNDMRIVAYSALNDDDPEIRTAGLLALSRSYQEADIPYLITEIYSAKQEIIQYILDNLLNYSDVDIVKSFFEQFNIKWKSVGDFSKALEVLGNLNLVWENAEHSSKLAAMSALANDASQFETGFENELIETLAEIDLSVLQEVISIKSNKDS